MRAFLQCVREAWKASRKSQGFFYNTLVVEDYGNKFRDLAASIIEEEDLATDFQDVLLKTPHIKDSMLPGSDYREELDAFVFDGRLK